MTADPEVYAAALEELRYRCAADVCENPAASFHVADHLPRDNRARVQLRSATHRVRNLMSAARHPHYAADPQLQRDVLGKAVDTALLVTWLHLEVAYETLRAEVVAAAEHAAHRTDLGPDLTPPDGYARTWRAAPRCTAPPGRPLTTVPHAPQAPPTRGVAACRRTDRGAGT